jgi:hypothetical protein
MVGLLVGSRFWSGQGVSQSSIYSGSSLRQEQIWKAPHVRSLFLLGWSIDYLEVTGCQVSASKDVSPIAPEKLSISIASYLDGLEPLRDLKRSVVSQNFRCVCNKSICVLALKTKLVVLSAT